MRRLWSTDELASRWALSPSDLQLTVDHGDQAKLGLICQLAFWREQARFPDVEADLAPAIVEHLARQIGVSTEAIGGYDFAGRSGRRHRRAVLDLFIGGTPLMTLQRGRADANGKHGHVVDYHHVVHALRPKPMALLRLVYRAQLFPLEAYARTFDRLLKQLPERPACRLMVDLLALAHDRGCEAELAIFPAGHLADNQLPDIAALRTRFAPDPASLPDVVVELIPLSAYQALLETQTGAAA